MARYVIESGVRSVPLRMVAYGPEGIGKTTFAAQMPDPVFIDVEGGSNQLPVARMPRPTSWTMLIDEVRAVKAGEVPCRTLVVDTADAAEVLCVRHICAKNNWDSIESPGYGKGYTHIEEEFGRLLDLLSEVVEGGRSVVLVSHAQMRKFERPDESGAYDRFELKLSKKVAPKVKEWADMVLFLDYKVFVTVGSDKKARANGGGRVIRTSHNVSWDAKNRFGLPDEMPLDDASAAKIASLMAGGESLRGWEPERRQDAETPAPATTQEAEPAREVAADPRDSYPERMSALVDLMRGGDVTDAELRAAVASKGYFPESCAATDYPEDFVAWLVTVWPSFMQQVETLRIQPPFSAK